MRNLKKQHNLSTFFVQSIDVGPNVVQSFSKKGYPFDNGLFLSFGYSVPVSVSSFVENSTFLQNLNLTEYPNMRKNLTMPVVNASSSILRKKKQIANATIPYKNFNSLFLNILKGTTILKDHTTH